MVLKVSKYSVNLLWTEIVKKVDDIVEKFTIANHLPETEKLNKVACTFCKQGGQKAWTQTSSVYALDLFDGG